MEEEHVLTLFEVFWFYHKIIPKPLSSLPPTTQIPALDKTQIEKPAVSPIQSLPYRSLSCELSSESDSSSPISVLPTSRLNRILSGKETEQVAEKITKQEVEEPKKKEMMGTRNKIRGTKSLSDLELEELKGILDLGFSFSDGEIDSRIISIVPGLQRVRRNAGGGGGGNEEEVDESSVSRPYLSEAWTVGIREENPLTKWRVPVGRDPTDMKNHLRLWASTVASTIR